MTLQARGILPPLFLCHYTSERSTATAIITTTFTWNYCLATASSLLTLPTLFLGPVRSWQSVGPRPRTLWTEDRRSPNWMKDGTEPRPKDLRIEPIRSSVGPAQTSVDPILFGRPEVGSDRHISARTRVRHSRLPSFSRSHTAMDASGPHPTYYPMTSSTPTRSQPTRSSSPEWDKET